MNVIFNYKQSLKGFMKQAKYTNYVLVIISENYLKSVNCMYEALEAMKDDNYKDRILPIVLDKTNIFNVIGKASYIEVLAKRIFHHKVETFNSRT